MVLICQLKLFKYLFQRCGMLWFPEKFCTTSLQQWGFTQGFFTMVMCEFMSHDAVDIHGCVWWNQRSCWHLPVLKPRNYNRAVPCFQSFSHRHQGFLTICGVDCVLVWNQCCRSLSCYEMTFPRRTWVRKAVSGLPWSGGTFHPLTKLKNRIWSSSSHKGFIKDELFFSAAVTWFITDWLILI